MTILPLISSFTLTRGTLMVIIGICLIVVSALSGIILRIVLKRKLKAIEEDIKNEYS